MTGKIFSSSPKPRIAFLPGNYKTVADAWSHGLNEKYWRHGLVFNQGNGHNVTRNRVRERLSFIACRLLRNIFGNRYRDKGDVRFLGVEEGSKKSYNQHYHVLMAIDGDHGWDVRRVQQEIKTIDAMFLISHGWYGEKPAEIECGWELGNRYHSYTTKMLQRLLRTPSREDADWFLC